MPILPVYDSTSVLQTQELRVVQKKEPCIRVNIRELNIELYTELSTLYTQTDGPYYYCDEPILNDHESILKSMY